MKRRDFFKTLNACRNKGRLSGAKVRALPHETKAALLHFIVRSRWPVITELLCPSIDMAWLHAMGYLYRTKGRVFEFIHTCEQSITDGCGPKGIAWVGQS